MSERERERERETNRNKDRQQGRGKKIYHKKKQYSDVLRPTLKVKRLPL